MPICSDSINLTVRTLYKPSSVYSQFNSLKFIIRLHCSNLRNKLQVKNIIIILSAHDLS